MGTKEKVIQNINLHYDKIANRVEEDLKKQIERELQTCGIMCRVFARKKTKESLIEKMEKKAELKYLPNNEKMQDLIGIRIVLYFKDDIEICISILNELYTIVGCEHDKYDTETFRPQRINYVFEIPNTMDYLEKEMQELCLIDNTFEVQIRTIFSEGWHEVEHDIRYKFCCDWETEEDLSRELNGIFAVLEVCDNDIMALCDKMAYRKYKDCKWESMIRNKFRLRFHHEPLSIELRDILDNDKTGIGKGVFRFSREKLVCMLRRMRVPKTCNNVIYLINATELHSQKIDMLTPENIKRKYKTYEQMEE